MSATAMVVARYLADQLEALIEVHERVQMDTPEDKALHAQVVEAFREALAKGRAALPQAEKADR